MPKANFRKTRNQDGSGTHIEIWLPIPDSSTETSALGQRRLETQHDLEEEYCELLWKGIKKGASLNIKADGERFGRRSKKITIEQEEMVENLKVHPEREQKVFIPASVGEDKQLEGRLLSLMHSQVSIGLDINCRNVQPPDEDNIRFYSDQDIKRLNKIWNKLKKCHWYDFKGEPHLTREEILERDPYYYNDWRRYLQWIRTKEYLEALEDAKKQAEEEKKNADKLVEEEEAKKDAEKSTWETQLLEEQTPICKGIWDCFFDCIKVALR